MGRRLDREIIEEIERLVIEELGLGGCHDATHVLRVRNLALKIAREIENIDEYVLELAALLHDIGRRGSERTGEHHARTSARLARKLLLDMGLERDIVERICRVIEEHSFSRGTEQTSLEAIVLSDADKLDAIGAIGIARAFMMSGELGRTIEETLEHFENKLLGLHRVLRTEQARKLAERRAEFLRKFYEEILRELEES